MVDYTSSAPVYRSSPYTLGAAGSATDFVEIYAENRFISIISATYGTQNDLVISIDDNQEGVCYAGFGIKNLDITKRWKKIKIRNVNAAANTVVVGFSEAEVIDNRSSVTIAGSVSSVAVLPTTVNTISDVSAAATSTTKIFTGSASVKEIWITNPEAAGGTTLRWGDGSTGASRGGMIPPQTTIIVTVQGVTTGDIYVYNPKASAILVPITYLT